MVKSEDILQEMNPGSTNIYVEGLIDHYLSRPDSFEDMSLIIFAAWFNFISNSQYEATNSNKKHVRRKRRLATLIKNYVHANLDDDNFKAILVRNYLSGKPQEDGEYFKLKNSKGWIQRRGRSKLVRYRNYDKNTVEERRDYFREQMMLYFPFRNLREVEDHLNMEEVYTRRVNIIAENKNEFNNIFWYSTA